MKLVNLTKVISFIVLAIAAMTASAQKAVVHSPLGRPDLEAIREATTNLDSAMYYPGLLRKFMANDTTMTDSEFQYFYYGTMFQEDYDPYRPVFRPKQLDVLKPIYQKDKRSRSERQMMLDYANAALLDNPVNIRQLANKVYVYEQNGKYDLAKIWQYKLNHILLVIASSGSGVDRTSARIVVYPDHEYDLLNLAGYTATGQRFEDPCYDYITVKPHNDSDPEGLYFDIAEMLRQYFLKHPSEQDDSREAISPES